MKRKNTLCSKLLAFTLIIVFANACGQKEDAATSNSITPSDTLKKYEALKPLIIMRTSNFYKAHNLIPPDEKYPDIAPLSMGHPESEGIIEPIAVNLTLNGQSIELLAGELNLSDLTTFKTYTSTISCPGVDCTDWMPGIRIIYGQKGNLLFLYYQPVLLCADSDAFNDANGKRVRHFNLCNDGDFYFYNGHFEKVDLQGEQDDMAQRIAMYQTKKAPDQDYGVQIRNPISGVFENFKPMVDENDATANVVKIVYPVEELIDLAKEPGMSGKVKLWNSLVPVDVDGVKYLRHNIELSTYDVTSNAGQLSIPGTARFSDLSHICPPRCSGEVFTMHITN